MISGSLSHSETSGSLRLLSESGDGGGCAASTSVIFFESLRFRDGREWV